MQAHRNDIIKALDECADHLERLYKEYPQLSSEILHRAVDDWRNRKSELKIDYGQGNPGVQLGEDLGKMAKELLHENSLEDVQEIMREEHGHDLSTQQLVRIIGHDTYVENLKQEVLFMQDNSISYNQIAKLWNDLERPALGDDSWDAEAVSRLVYLKRPAG
jgi:hypothetical protein